MAIEATYICRRCRQHFPHDRVWRSDTRFICLDCARLYKKDQDQAGMQRLERTVGGVLDRLERLRFRGQCLACDGYRVHAEDCPVLRLGKILTPQRGQFSGTTHRLQTHRSRKTA